MERKRRRRRIMVKRLLCCRSFYVYVDYVRTIIVRVVNNDVDTCS